MENLIKIGNIVHIKAEYCITETEKQMEFVVTDVNEATGRCVIQQKDSPLPLAPTEIVGLNMVEKVEG